MLEWRPSVRASVRALFIFIFLLILSWQLVASVQPRSQRLICFVISVFLILCSIGIKRLPNRRFLAIKISYSVGAAIALRHWNIAFARDDFAFLVFYFAILLLFLCLPPFPAHHRQPWWPAVKRTIRRLRGDWPEDESQFAAGVVDDKK